MYTGVGTGTKFGAGSGARAGAKGFGKNVILIHSAEYCSQNRTTEFGRLKRGHLLYDAEFEFNNQKHQNDIINLIGKTFGWV